MSLSHYLEHIRFFGIFASQSQCHCVNDTISFNLKRKNEYEISALPELQDNSHLQPGEVSHLSRDTRKARGIRQYQEADRHTCPQRHPR